jgi:hypothetical protein
MYYVNDINLVPKMGQIIKVQQPVSSASISGLYVILEAAFTIETEYPEKTTDLSLAIVKLYHILYNNTPSKAIVNAASNITYRPLIEADDTGKSQIY